MLGLVDFQHFGGEVGSVAVAEFLHGVHTGGFQQFCELRADTLNTEKVCVIHPGEDEVSTDTGFFFQLLTAFGGGTGGKQFFICVDTCSDEFFCENRANTLNVNNFVSHGYVSFY